MPDLNHETVHVLFAQSETTRRLSQLPKSKPLDAIPKAVRPMVESFLVCHAKIELWLLGHHVEPDGSSETGLRAGMTIKGAKRLRMLQNPKGFYWCLIAFCRDYNETVETRAERITSRGFLKRFPAIFKAMYSLHSNSLEPNDPAAARELSDHLERAADEEPELLNREWKAKATLGGRVKDGLRRAWGWIKRVVKKAAGFVVGVVRNLVRLAAQLASHGFGMVWAAVKSFPHAVSFVVRSEFEGSSDKGVAIHHDSDFDWTAFVASQPDQTQLDSTLLLLEKRTAQFSFCLRLLKLLVVALSKVTKYMVAGYVGLAMALVRLRPYFEEFAAFYAEHKDWLLVRKRAMARA